MAVVGIDLGTTNSSVAVFKDGWTTVIQDENGSRLLPSVVTFTEKELLVGPRATSCAHKYPKNTIYDAKRFIGQKYHDKNVQNDIASSLYEIVNKDGFPHVNVTYKNEKLILSIEEVSAYVLKQLKRITENHLNGSVNEAVITVPAHFDDARRNATKRAAKIAGFDIIHLINEPTAAAIASQYRSTKTHRRKILVYDFGGGTFDVSIISIVEKHFNVLATSGDCYLGGKDLDMILMSHVKKAVEDDGGRSITDRKTLNRLRNICEEAKKNLSLSLEYYIDLPGVIDDYKITREDFERLNEDSFQRTVKVVDNCLTASKLTVDDIDEVILVGGSSRVQRVRDILRTKFPKSTIDTTLNPDEAIACGAAIYGAKLNGDKVELVIEDVLSVSLGVECRCDIMHHTIKRNTSLPSSASVTYSTAHHFQTELPISVYQGESLIASRNKFLGKFTISNIRKERRGVVQILTTFNVDEEGILKVTASEVGAANNSRELIVSISDEIAIMSETSDDRTDEEELKHIECSIKKLRLLEYCDDLIVDYKESLATRPDISGKIEEACEKCESLKADGITIVEDLMSELELLVENIDS